MWLHRFTNYILQHRYITIVLVFLCTFSSTYLGKFVADMPVLLSLLSMLVAVLLGTIAITTATLVTLVQGLTVGAILTAAATLPYIISVYVPGGSTEAVPALSLWVGVGVAVTSNVLTWVFAVMLRRQANWSFILQVAALMGVLVVSVIHLVFPSVVNWWGSQLQSLQNFYTQAAAGADGAQATAQTAVTTSQVEFINFAKQLVNGFLAAAILGNALVQLIVARWWQAIVFMPGILRRELQGIRLSQLAGILFILSMVVSYSGRNSVVLDIMPILYMLFAAAGLSVVHYMFGLMNSPTVWFWLSLFYVTLIIASPFSLAIITMLGLLDIWLDIRKRLRKI